MFFKSKKSDSKKPSKVTGSTVKGTIDSHSVTPTPGQKVPPMPPPRSAASSPDLLEVDFANPPPAIANSPFDIEAGELVLAAGQSWRGEPSMKASEGEVFEIETRARLIRPPSNGATNGFYVGPLICDGNGEVLSWWATIPQVLSSEGFRQITVRAVAPAGAASVGIGICGTWSGDDKPADFIVGFRKVTLKRVVA